MVGVRRVALRTNGGTILVPGDTPIIDIAVALADLGVALEGVGVAEGSTPRRYPWPTDGEIEGAGRDEH